MCLVTGRRIEGMADLATLETDAECEPLQAHKMSPSLVNGGLMQQHECHRRKDHSYWGWNILQAWWLVPSHLAMVAIVTAFCFYIDNKLFRIYSGSPEGDMNDVSSPYQSDISAEDDMNDLASLYQSDIVTILTALLVITRMFAAAWQALCAWRCVYILLEKAGIRLEDIRWILSRGLLVPPLRKCSWWHVLSALALLMAWPAMVASPILLGSISWYPISHHQWGHVNGSVPMATDISSSYTTWSDFEEYPEFREIVVKTAAGRASLALNLLNVVAQNPPVVAQRISSVLGEAQTLGTWVRNVTAPAIYLDNGTWVDEDLPPHINSSLLDGASGLLNISKETSPLLVDRISGNAAILKGWKWMSEDVLENRHIWTGEQYAALLVGTAIDTNDTNCTRYQYFEHAPGRVFRSPLRNSVVNCYQVLKLNVTAGVTRCETLEQPESYCEVDNLSVATFYPIGTTVAIENDILLPMVFNLMPEVMQSLVAMSGMGSIDARAGEIVGASPQLYLETIITAAYQGTWSALTSLFGQEDLEYNATVITKVMAAQVWKPRLLLWLLLNLLLTMSGALLCMMQNLCNQPPLVDKFMPGKCPPASFDAREEYPLIYGLQPSSTTALNCFARTARAVVMQ